MRTLLLGKMALVFLLSLFFLKTASCKDANEKEEIKKTFKFASTSGPKKVVIDNMDGFIDVVGYDGDEVQLVAHKEIRAESDRKIKEAKEEVTLEIREEPNKIVLYVDAPWRGPNGSMNYRGWHYYGYEVSYDFELKVPRKTSLYLRTVNNGRITVQNVEGEFEVSDVNAGIEMTGITGSAKVATVNGPIKVTFNENPESECHFKTVNGKVEVEFKDGLSADLRLKSFNGQVYTDFDVEGLPRKISTMEERKGRRRIYRRGDSYSVRVGKGGPEFSFDTLNGNIYILKKN